MTLQQCYAQMDANYEEVQRRLLKDERIQKILLLFLKDPSYDSLKESMDREDWETAFRAAHTIKGISLNLGLTRLQKSSSELSEALRNPPPAPGAQAVYETLTADYEQAAAAIRQFQAELPQ